MIPWADTDADPVGDIRRIVEAMAERGLVRPPETLTLSVTPGIRKALDDAGMIDAEGFVGTYAGIPVRVGGPA